MNDKEILEEVYRMTRKHLDDAEDASPSEWVPCRTTAKLISDYIEQEWQRQDDIAPRQTGWEGKKWYTDVRDMERHRVLEIGENGTVKELK